MTASLAAGPGPSLMPPAAPGIAARVKAQLQGDYPPGALAWVDDLTWAGKPQLVPLSQIDMSGADPDWAAARKDTAKLTLFRRKIAAGFRKPVVAVRHPGSRLLRLVDGHTRALACLALGLPVTAWVGTAKAAHGPWEAVHSRQLANDGRALDLATAPGLNPRSGMISLDLPAGTIKPAAGGLDWHHVTVVYLGPDLDDGAFARACARARDAAAAADGPLSGTVSGVDSFTPSPGSDGKVPAFAPATIPGAQALRAKLEDLSASEHKDWVPHVTLSYIGKDDPLPAPVPPTSVKFTHLSAHRGDDVRRFPLGPGAGEYAGDALSVELSAQTPVLAVTPAPYGRPGGPGLYGVKGQKHSDYFEHVVQAMLRRGKTRAQASAMAWGILRRWAAGGGNVHPEVRAAAAAALAEEAAKPGHSHAGGAGNVIELAGPKGFVHGWVFVGVPDLGARVSHPQLGPGVVTGHDGAHVTVKFGRDGSTRSFEARGGTAGGAAKLAPRAEGSAASPFTIIRGQSGKGWAVREEGQPGWVHSSPTRKGAQDYADRVTKQRAALAAAETEGNARTAALLKSRGIGLVDYRQLEPGDQFTWNPQVPPKTVIRVRHLASGASLITWEKDAHTPRGENHTLMTPGYKAYGRLESGHSHANGVAAVDLAGAFTESLHPRSGGKFASKGGSPVSAARARHGAKVPAVQGPAASGGATRAQQLRYQAAQDRHIAQQIMVKVAGLVRARDAAAAGLPAHPGKTASPAGAAAKAAAKFAAGKKAPVSRVARLDGQIRLLRRDARLLIHAANHLDAQASGL